MFGKAPINCGMFDIKDKRKEFRRLYLPIKMKNSAVNLPVDCITYEKLVNFVVKNEDLRGKYLYLTIDNKVVNKGGYHRREGWHSDGFMTDDITYIWSDCLPTIFNNSKFKIIKSCNVSMEQFKEQALEENNFTLPVKSLIRMDQYVIHKTPQAQKTTKRIFVKINISKHRYNLEGNSYNHLFEYKWKMYCRQLVRNHPIFRERDFINKKIN